ncbi:hypothetical protein D1000_07080 [Riemerella anatipestifer]|uniref:Uncharacterized protein n=2 Tax=Riemerella anatipestifer TaxID=34085 RepID=A0A1S7DU77_RIEAN|nr:hypothetical protein AB406_1750 [Riemerella anatipestifer]MRM84382.1 hypothetical protein [Riemerella anatipestifer]MRN16581.1 hypothetical protein [Riemerella anatipestifer]MRQ22710.1 hypothetical protein [Riemerella anatipestifer]
MNYKTPGVLSLKGHLFYFWVMEYREELQIAKKAEQMLTSALRNRTKSFKEHYNRKEDAASLKDAEAKAKIKRYGKFKDGNQKIFMRSLAIKMAKHGFAQHYGVDTVRQGAERKRTKPNNISYFYKEHDFKMEARPFIDTAIEDSGVIPFVMENVSKLRAQRFAEELIFTLKQFSK